MDDTNLKARTGVDGLDDVLVGGLRRGRVYLLEGSPGTGKTTIASQFLMEGAARGERGLYITLSETETELRETTKRIFEVVERAQPTRIVLDSLSEIRLLAQSSLRYRRQILALKHYFARHGATVLLLDDL